MNQGIHGVDLLLHVMGPVRSVCAYTRTLARRIEVEDTASAVVEFESSALGVIQATTSIHPGFPRRLEIHGDKGTIALEEDSIVTWSIQGQDMPADITLGRSSGDAFHDPTVTDATGHIRQIGDLVEAVRDDRRPFVDEHEGRNPVELILAIYESSRTRKEVVLGRRKA